MNYLQRCKNYFQSTIKTMKLHSKIQVVIEFTKLNGGNIKKNAFKKRLPENKIVNSHPNCRTKPACNGLL